MIASRCLLVCSLFLALSSHGIAKDPVELEPEDKSPLVLSEPSGVDVSFIMPGWLAGIEGTVGVLGTQSEVDAGFDDILRNLDMIAAGTLHVQNDKLGFLLDGMYLKASVGGNPPGPLLSNVDVGVKQVLAEAAFTYRIHEGEKGWIELIGGARYWYLSNTLQLTVDDAGVRDVSENLSSRVVSRAVEEVNSEVDSRLPALLADLRPRVTSELGQRVANRIDDVRQAIADRIDDGIGGGGPGIGGAISDRGPVRDAIRDYVKAEAAARIEAARAESSAALAAARSGIRQRADARVEAAKERLSDVLEREISNRIPEQEISDTQDWVDPFIGLRSHCQLNDGWHLALRGDIGGFGVGSDFSWNLYGALGHQIDERTSIELGYRYLAVDYQSGGFTFDMATGGPFVGLTITY